MAQLGAVKPTPKGLALLAVLAGIGFIVCAGAYVMGSNALNKANIELRDRERQLEDSKKIADRLEQAEIKYAAAESQVSFLEHSVSTRDFIPTLLKQLEHLGRSVDLKVLSVRPKIEQQPRPASRRRDPAAEAEGVGKSESGTETASNSLSERKPYDSLTIDIEVEGKYANLMSFLYRVTTAFPKILEVNTIQISPTAQPKRRESPYLSMEINVTAYLFPVEQNYQTTPSLQPSQAEARMTRRVVADDERYSYEHG